METLDLPQQTLPQNEQLITKLATPKDLRQANEEFSKVVKALFGPLPDHLAVVLQDSDEGSELAHERQALTNQLLWEFEQVQARCQDRAEVIPRSDGGSEARLVFRDKSGTRAEERFLMVADENGELMSGECVTSFGNDSEYLRRIKVEASGISVYNEVYDGIDANGSSHWEEMEDPAEVSHALVALSSTMTESLIRFIERDPEAQHEADASALTIARRLGARALAL